MQNLEQLTGKSILAYLLYFLHACVKSRDPPGLSRNSTFYDVLTGAVCEVGSCDSRATYVQCIICTS